MERSFQRNERRTTKKKIDMSNSCSNYFYHINIDKLNTCMCARVAKGDKKIAHTLKTAEIVPNLSKIPNEFNYAVCVCMCVYACVSTNNMQPMIES